MSDHHTRTITITTTSGHTYEVRPGGTSVNALTRMQTRGALGDVDVMVLPPGKCAFIKATYYCVVMHLGSPAPLELSRNGVWARVQRRPGDLIVRPPGVYSSRWDVDGRRIMVARIAAPLVEAFIGEGTRIPLDLLSRDAIVTEHMLQMHDTLVSSRGAIAPAVVDAWLERLAQHIARRYVTERAAMLSPAAALRVRHMLRQRAFEPLDLVSLATSCGLHPTEFARAWHRAGHEDVFAVVERERVAAAKRMQRQSAMSLSTIAQLVGYAEPEHLRRALRRSPEFAPG